MLNQPRSSPMMKTMFGFFADDVDAALAVVVTAPACASSTFLAIPSEQQEGLSAPWSVTPVPAAAGRAAGVAVSARDKGLKSFVAATKPSIAPNPTHASDWIDPIFMSEIPPRWCKTALALPLARDESSDRYRPFN